MTEQQTQSASNELPDNEDGDSNPDLSVYSETQQLPSHIFEKSRSLMILDLGRVGSIEGIGDSACSDCDLLATVKLCPNLRHIGARAFYRCPSLSDVDFESAPNLESIGEFAFALCVSLKHVDLSNLMALIFLSVQSFSYCTALQEVKLAPNLHSIEREAFHHCWNLKKVYWNENLVVIHEGAFANCTRLQTLDLRDAKKLRTLGERSFYCDESLSLLAFGPNIQEIGYEAMGFRPNIDCIDLSMSKDLETIMKYSFLRKSSAKCIKLSSRVQSLPWKTRTIRDFFKNTGNIEVIGKGNLPLLIRLKARYLEETPLITMDKLLHVYAVEKTSVNNLMGVIHDDIFQDLEKPKLGKIENEFANAVWCLVQWRNGTGNGLPSFPPH
mmetsp:Transcript_5925/g.14040  ORF Transcript_5925/g.14040 Transcript_5925/m.14040 type:complete len:384 (-) Transcript_5925:310-1461(-)|eukprot:CAMPEP_0113619870 /NCGR_PEP_ID=MMETSP0017_2-20120614/10104_1 /TAXON_ID=2856 /ORGANISM="Cylindrotheca closterium" /LENGTH=383 /DNA_ID=CAMNT_0000529481 /DNA_START=79 /DNA_END=1230 /DNA_ORIENTATION=+ /assembly_acc=CAM_ASM_000147